MTSLHSTLVWNDRMYAPGGRNVFSLESPGAPAFFRKPLKAKQLHASSAFNCSFQVQSGRG
jgi:hypothetical protein